MGWVDPSIPYTDVFIGGRSMVWRRKECLIKVYSLREIETWVLSMEKETV